MRRIVRLKRADGVAAVLAAISFVTMAKVSARLSRVEPVRAEEPEPIWGLRAGEGDRSVGVPGEERVVAGDEDRRAGVGRRPQPDEDQLGVGAVLV